MRTKTKALQIARIARDKKAENILVLDVRKVCNFTEYFVLATGLTNTHLRAICEEVKQKLKARGVTLYAVDGGNTASWRVLDFGDVILHCFDEETRLLYDLEHLWGDALNVKWT